MELKVGSRIRLRKSSIYYKSNVGNIDSHGIGTIVDTLRNGKHRYAIKWDSMKHVKRVPNADCYLRYVDIELSRVKATKLAKKIYPNAVEKDGWLEI